MDDEPIPSGLAAGEIDDGPATSLQTNRPSSVVLYKLPVFLPTEIVINCLDKRISSNELPRPLFPWLQHLLLLQLVERFTLLDAFSTAACVSFNIFT